MQNIKKIRVAFIVKKEAATCVTGYTPSRVYVFVDIPRSNIYRIVR